MIKLVFCLRRLSHLSREDFQRYWLDSHGPLVRELAPALNVKRYAQVHTVSSAFGDALRRHRGAPEDFDGVAELWWESVEDFARAGSTAEGREAGRRLLEDEKRFIDLARSPIWFGEEHALVDLTPTSGSRGSSGSR
ncbi:MAG: EthD domain-containing protein [Candidatus Rokuibacteriota bacterium]